MDPADSLPKDNTLPESKGALGRNQSPPVTAQELRSNTDGKRDDGVIQLEVFQQLEEVQTSTRKDETRCSDKDSEQKKMMMRSARPSNFVVTNSASVVSNSDVGRSMVVQTFTGTEVGFAPFTRKVNQDSSLVHIGLNGNPEIDVFGVFDGHGEFGHQVSQFVAGKLPEFIGNEIETSENPISALENAISNLCKALKSSRIRTTYSGTTATIALRCSSMLYIANIGDSRAVLASRSGDTDKLKCIPLSNDHKPDLPGEKERILSRGGRVETLKGPPGVDCGPYRVWLSKANIPGLAMSRSIGDDVAHTVGVISSPEITVHEIKSEDAFLLMATDGVWEFIQNEEAISLLEENIWDLNSGVRRLVRKSQKRWKRYEHVIDDITAVVVKFTSGDNF